MSIAYNNFYKKTLSPLTHDEFTLLCQQVTTAKSKREITSAEADDLFSILKQKNPHLVTLSTDVAREAAGVTVEDNSDGIITATIAAETIFGADTAASIEPSVDNTPDTSSSFDGSGGDFGGGGSDGSY